MAGICVLLALVLYRSMISKQLTTTTNAMQNVVLVRQCAPTVVNRTHETVQHVTVQLDMVELYAISG
ncbi:hypothetical protein ANCDUO_27738 [Ancylostoma duodenale]|uniref:Secreted protein n=1 Tax=Ancylostoma duodenale TaxID=51022 RepID=A0A0C2F5L4_9BILA|nr:hypothetical protein ANCDUO_27738 [Ancylostoma duodenale]